MKWAFRFGGSPVWLPAQRLMRNRIARTLLWLSAGLMLALPAASWAQIIRPFTIRYTANSSGDLVMIGNNTLTCDQALDANCVIARADTNYGGGGAVPLNNNNYASAYVDIDGDPTTFSSSSATLAMPAGSTVLFAGLYWGGVSFDPAANRVLFKPAGAGGYTPTTASQLDYDNVSTVNGGANYSAFADVTSLVKAAGNGSYTVANVQSTTGATNQWGGWSLVVVLSNNSLPLRNMVVYDGFASVNNSGGSVVVLSLTGFLTPLSGPVITQVGTFGFDGDRNSFGDQLQVNSSTNPVFTVITDAANPPNNFYNSTIADSGVINSSRNPADNNTLGIEVDRFILPSGVIGNGATFSQVRVISTGEQYLPAVLTFATDLYVPIITPNLLKTATDLNGGALVPGDILRWNISMNNTGQDSGINLILRDGIPANTTYVPGTLRITAGANSGTKTDLPTVSAPTGADDQAEYSTVPALCSPAPAPCVIFRLGTGASGTSGGTLAFGQATALSFDVTVNANVSAGTQISNTAYISYNGQTLSTTSFAASSAAVTAVVLGPPGIAKSFTPPNVNTGIDSVLTVTLTNAAANPSALTGVTFSDTYPANLVNSPVPAAAISCTAGSTPGTITGGIAAGNTIGLNPGAIIQPGGSCTITVNVRSAVAGLYTNTTSPATSTNGGSSSAGATAILTVGLPAIVKSFTKAAIEDSTGAPIGNQQAIMRFAITNPTGAAISALTFTDTWTASWFTAPNGTTTPTSALAPVCPGANSLVITGTNNISYNSGAATLAAGTTCYIDVTVTGVTAGNYTNQTGAIGSSIGSGQPSNVAPITVVGPPTVTKSFSPSVIGSGGNSQLSIVFANPNSVTLTRAGVVVTDTYPGAMTNVTPVSVGFNCSAGSTGSIGTCTGGGTSCAVQNMTLAPGGSCTLQTLVTTTTAGANNNALPAVVFDNAPDPVPAPATLTVSNLTAPTVTKVFRDAADTVNVTDRPVGVTSRMLISIPNPGGNGATALTGATFTDAFPVGLILATPPNPVLTTCGAGTLDDGAGGALAAGGGQIRLLNGTVPGGGGTCQIRVNVTSATFNTYTNSTGTVSYGNAPQSASVIASIAFLNPPTVTKSFNPTFMGTGGISTLTITVANPPGNAATLTGVSVTDTLPILPAAMTIANGTTTNNCTAGSTAGTLRNQAAAAIGVGDTGIQYGVTTAATLAVGGSCTFTVQVTAGSAGNYSNTTGAVNSTNGGTGGTASATLAVGKIGIAKAFNLATIVVNGTSTLTFTLTNPLAVAVSGIAFTDTLTNISLASATVGGTCAGVTSNAGSGVTNFQVTAGTIPANSSCTIIVTATGSISGTYPNTTSGVTRSGDAVAGNPSNTAVLTVTPPPSISKTFLTPQIGTGGNSVLRLRLFNLTAGTMDNVSYSDTFPAGLVVNASPGVTNTCGGSVTGGGAGAGNIGLSNGQIQANSACDITVNVTSAVAGAYINTIPVGAVVSTAGNSVTAASDTLTVLVPLTVTKAFAPSAVAVNGTSVMTVTLSNSNATAVAGASFTDTYPLNLVNAASPVASTTCAGGTVTAAAAANQLILSNGTVAASSSCTVTVTVTSGIAGSYTNGGFGVTTTNAGSSTSGNATLSIGRPSITKLFSPNPIGAGGTSILTITVNNPANVTATVVGFTDTFPAGIVVSSSPNVFNSCGGTLTGGTAGVNNIGINNNGTIAANGSCQVRVNVTNPAPGVLTNTIASAQANLGAGVVTGGPAVGSLTTLTPLTVTKSFNASVVGLNQNSVLTIRLTNPNAFAVANAAIADDYPANLVNSPSPAGATTCGGGTVTALGGVPQALLSGATVPANSFCEVTVNVRSALAGAYSNTIPAAAVTSDAGSSAASNTATLTVLNPPTITKSFAAATTPLNTGILMTITLTNPNTTAITGAAFTDTYPSGLVNAAPPGAATTCAGGTPAATAGGGTLTFSGGTVPLSGSCTVTVNVSSSTATSYINSTGIVTTVNAGSANPATAGLLVMAPLLAFKSFSPVVVAGAATSGMTVTLTNSNPVAVTGGAIVDNYPATLINVNPPLPTLTGAGCIGTTVATNGTNAFSYTNGTVPANSTCTIFIVVQATLNGNQTNTTASITSSNAGTSANVSATLTRGLAAGALPPTISKTFTPSSMAPGGVSTLSFNVVNPSTANNLTAVTFTDNFPAGLVVATPLVTTNNCAASTWAPVAGAGTASMTGATINANGGGTANCTVTVQVTASSAGVYNNVSGQVGSSAGNGNTASAVLTVINPPTVIKGIAPATITQGGTATVNITLFNSNNAALTGAAFSDLLTNMQVASGATTNSCGGVLTAAVGSGSITLSGGTIPAAAGATAGSCTVTVPVTSFTVGTWPNSTTGVTTTQTPSAGAGSNVANLTVSPVTSQVTGFVYADVNSNGVKDGSEDWTTGTIIYVNLVQGGTVVQSQAVTPGTGAFNFPFVPYGNYTILVTTGPASSAAAAPAGWFFTYPTNGTLGLNANGTIQPQFNFGLFGSGASQVSGVVFRDTGGGGSTANDGILGAGEGLLNGFFPNPGISNNLVRLTDCAATTYATAVTDGAGNYKFNVPGGATSLCVVRGAAPNLIATGASNGATAIAAGTCAPPPGAGFNFNRVANTLCFTNSPGTGYANLNFGVVPENIFVSDNAANTSPGLPVLYRHVFTAGSVGTVIFTVPVQVVQPNAVGWSTILYRDANCNGLFDALEGATIVTGNAFAVDPNDATVGEPSLRKICLIAKVSPPPSTAFGTQHVATLLASFTYTNAAPALFSTYTRTDTTRIGGSGDNLDLRKEVCNLTKSACNASTGAGFSNANTGTVADTIQYRIIYFNNSSAPLTNLVINDTTPPFTVRAGTVAAFVTTPAPLVAGVVTQPLAGAAGAFQWTFTGSLNPQSQGIVTFDVTIQ